MTTLPDKGTPLPDTGMASVSGQGAAVRFRFPPLLFAAPLAAALAADRWRPLRLPGGRMTRACGIGLVAGGGVLMAAGASTILGHHTTIVPERPVSTLVTGGPYRISRNPMYLGMALVTAGTGLIRRTGWPLLTLPLSVAAAERLVIRPEEQYLADRFGEGYDRFRRRVRRWI